MPIRLIGEMKRRGIKQKDIALLLNRTSNSVRMKLKSIRPFTSLEMFLIRDSFFPDLTLDELFKE